MRGLRVLPAGSFRTTSAPLSSCSREKGLVQASSLLLRLPTPCFRAGRQQTRTRGTTMSGDGGPRAPAAAQRTFSISLLPPDCLERIATLGFLTQVSPFWDRGDLLQQAASLACVGNRGCSDLARLLFEGLSPRLGQELPGGVTEASKAVQLKAACREWGLAVSGSKPDLWERLQDQVQDSEEGGEDGATPTHCIVSGATRKELQGYSRTRVTAGRAASVFGLTKYDQRSLTPITEFKGSKPVKLLLLSEVKQRARETHPRGYAAFAALQQQNKENSERWKAEYKEKKAARLAELRAELARRGHSAAAVESVMTRNPNLPRVEWGSYRDKPASESVDLLELMWCCINDGEREDYLSFRFATDPMRPPNRLSKSAAHEERLDRATTATLRWWVCQTDSVQELRDDPKVPASLLPELERLWHESRSAAAAGVAGPSNAAHMEWAHLLDWEAMGMANAYDDDNEEYYDECDDCCCG